MVWQTNVDLDSHSHPFILAPEGYRCTVTLARRNRHTPTSQWALYGEGKQGEGRNGHEEPEASAGRGRRYAVGEAVVVESGGAVIGSLEDLMEAEDCDTRDELVELLDWEVEGKAWKSGRSDVNRGVRRQGFGRAARAMDDQRRLATPAVVVGDAVV